MVSHYQRKLSYDIHDEVETSLLTQVTSNIEFHGSSIGYLYLSYDVLKLFVGPWLDFLMVKVVNMWSYSFKKTDTCPFSLSPRKWKPSFYPNSESFYKQKNWVMFLGYPMEPWNKYPWEEIVYPLGCFNALEEERWIKEYYRVFKLLVKMDLREGFVVEINIESGGLVLHSKIGFL